MRGGGNHAGTREFDECEFSSTFVSHSTVARQTSKFRADRQANKQLDRCSSNATNAITFADDHLKSSAEPVEMMGWQRASEAIVEELRVNAWQPVPVCRDSP